MKKRGTRRAATTASVAELKARLSEHLRAVKAGGEVLVTERGRPIARLVPVSAELASESRNAQLERGGLVRAAGGKLSPDFLAAPRPRDPNGRALQIVFEERSERR
jgi:prevent-host-death family protein